jgi:iron(II)-dependent oxidoreductase
MADASGLSAPPLSDTQRWLQTPWIRQAGREVLSLALMDARNHSLRLLETFAQAMAQGWPDKPDDQLPSATWVLGRIGWFQERWILRNLQRNLGSACEARSLRLAAIRPQADAWWDGQCDAWADDTPPDLPALRADLLQILEATLDLLAGTPETDESLYFYRLALHHEDMQGERLLQIMQARGLAPERDLIERCTPAAWAPREALRMPATRARLGHGGPGLAFDNERPVHELAIPEFEIDAQPVTWAQFLEFVDDGGYDQPAWWSEAGWAWLQAASDGQSRRAPRYVEQIGAASGAVLQTRFGRPTRLAGQQAAMHLSWWEAQAWCRWAGRRLPLEAEWEVAAATASRRGFRWGDVWEWTAGSLQPYAGFSSGPDAAYSQTAFGRAKVLRGGSIATPARCKSPVFRHFAPPDHDALFCGFRSCAL